MENNNTMFSPEQNQLAICLLKTNIEDIENDLIAQRVAWPDFDAENEQTYRESMNALRVARSLSIETERLKQENAKLVAKRMQLKQQIDDINKAIEKARENRSEMENTLKQEDQKIEEKVRGYEESLREKAERFRKTRIYYNEIEMNAEIEKINQVIFELENEETQGRNVFEELRRRLDGLTSAVPDDLLTIIGKEELNEKLKALTEQCESLKRKRNNMKSNISFRTLKK